MSVKEKDIKPIITDARLMGERAGISERIGWRPCEMARYCVEGFDFGRRTHGWRK